MSRKEFKRVEMNEARFRDVDLSGARFERVNLSGAVLRGAEMFNVEIDGAIYNLTINGVDVVPLVEAELDRRFPDRVKMRPTDTAGFREAWDLVERLWDGTIARARGLRPELLHERVDEEWSFIETLRHLVFATDAWVRRVILGDPKPWDASICRSTRCATHRACRATATYVRPWMMCWLCGRTGWPQCAR